MSDNTIKYRSWADIEEGVITLNFESAYGHHVTTISKWRLDTEDKLIREALVKLGWTPPPEKKNDDWRGGHEPHCNTLFPAAGDASCDCIMSKPIEVSHASLKKPCQHVPVPLFVHEDPLIDAGCKACGQVRRITEWGPR